MNNLQPTIKYTFNHSKNQIYFLDLLIQVILDRQLSATLSREPTVCMPLLHFLSSRLLQCKESIILSEVLLCNLIFNENHNLQQELDHLTLSLLTRDYPLKIINKNI